MIDLSHKEAQIDEDNWMNDDEDDIDDVERYSRSQSYTSRTSRLYQWDYIDSDDSALSEKDYKNYFEWDEAVEPDKENTIESDGGDGNDLTKNRWLEYAKESCDWIRIIRIRDQSFTISFIKIFLTSYKNPVLHELSLVKTNVTTEDVKWFTNAASLQNVKKLDLSNNKIKF